MINANKDLFLKVDDDPGSTTNQLADKALKRITGQTVEGEVRKLLFWLVKSVQYWEY